MKNKNLKGNLILMLVAVVWGISFVSQSAGRDIIGTNTFNGIRMLIGSFVLLPVIFVRRKFFGTKSNTKALLKSGLLCGTILCMASTLQTWGIAYTTAGKSSFITAMYIIFVPIIGFFIGKKITLKTVICAIIALIGMYLLCMTGDTMTINIGEMATLICSIMFTFHILCLDSLSDDIDAIEFSSLQFFVCGAINIILMFIFEEPSFEAIKQSAIPLLYAGACSCGIGYALQPVGQRYTDPTSASIIMSLESVFGLLGGMVILGDMLTIPEFLGCVIMFTAIILIQIPSKKIGEI